MANVLKELCFWLLAFMILFFNSCIYEKGNPSVPTPSVNCDSAQITYTADIDSIFQVNCAISGCHEGTSPAKGLDLTSYSGLMDGSNTGSMVVINDHLESKLWQAVENGTMPPGVTSLSTSNVNLIADWIDEGACDK